MRVKAPRRDAKRLSFQLTRSALPHNWTSAMNSRILVSLDSSAASLRGLDEAIGLAACDGSALRLVHVVNASRYRGGDGGGTDLIAWMQEAGEQVLQQGRECAQAAGIAAGTLPFTTRMAHVADIDAEQAGAWGAGLIVAGAQGNCRDFGRALQSRTSIPAPLVRAGPNGEAGTATVETRVAVAA